MLVESGYPHVFLIGGLSSGLVLLAAVSIYLLVRIYLERIENKKISQFNVSAVSKHFKLRPGKVVRINQRLAYSLGESRITFYFKDVVEFGVSDIVTIPQISEAILLPENDRVLWIVIKKNSFYTWNECFELIVSHIMTLMDPEDDPTPPDSE